MLEDVKEYQTMIDRMVVRRPIDHFHEFVGILTPATAA
ncbi:uncharacterized protein METZ01_LOCUS489545 [marine metagenome]|uniref:Uncharacterized protein n=1 Tax=marine metagenome TaxID=408172 RepID=A0A383CX02_9ZZZZ